MKDINTVQRQNKRQALIDAAVRLIVEKGDPRLASTRTIVSMAHTSKSAIDYHFGNKAGLITAVLDELRKMHNCHCISDYEEKNKDLLNTHAGKIKFVNGLLDSFQDFFQKNESNAWHILLRQRVIQSYHEIGGSILSIFLESDVNAFYGIFRKITGRNSADEAYAWFMTIMLPLSTRGYRKNKLAFWGKHVELSLDYDEYFLAFCKKSLLNGWGLNFLDDESPANLKRRC